jgi:hypothetical protein
MASLNKMEHRLDSREKQSIPVNIYTQGLFELGGVIKDIGRGGTFIEIEIRDFSMNCFEVKIPLDFTARNNNARNNAARE